MCWPATLLCWVLRYLLACHPTLKTSVRIILKGRSGKGVGQQRCAWGWGSPLWAAAQTHIWGSWMVSRHSYCNDEAGGVWSFAAGFQPSCARCWRWQSGHFCRAVNDSTKMKYQILHGTDAHICCFISMLHSKQAQIECSFIRCSWGALLFWKPQRTSSSKFTSKPPFQKEKC